MQYHDAMSALCRIVNRRRFTRYAIFAFILLTICLFKNPEWAEVSVHSFYNKSSYIVTSEEPKLILLTKFAGKQDMWDWEHANNVCSKKCVFTNQLSAWKSSSVIVFHGSNHIFLIQELVRPSPSQVWVWMNHEPAVFYPADFLTSLGSENMLQFNWTLTYRHDSDIVAPYRHIYRRGSVPPEMQKIQDFVVKFNGHSVPEELPSLDGFKQRKMAAWIVSHCNSSSKREILVTELQKHIEVDIYGACGNKKCHETNPVSVVNPEKCRFEIHKKYKFYLAFENALCTDYVTEKFFETLFFDMVPVVYGSVNYTRLFPRNSFINVQDFKSISALLSHLRLVANSRRRWLSYFAWRKDYTIIDSQYLPAYCAICDAATATPDSSMYIPQKTYADVGNWWVHNYAEELPYCKSKNESQQFLETFFKKPLFNNSGSRTRNKMHRFL